MESRPVIYIAGEGHNGIKRRLTAWEQHFELSLKDALLFVSSAPVPFLDAAAAQVVRQKVDEAALPDPLYRRFETVELGKASDGTVMTSAVLLPTEGGVTDDKKVHPTQREQYGIQSYCEIAKDKGHISADEKELLVHAEDWRPAFYMCIALDDAAAKKKAFQRVREGLMSKGFLAQPQENIIGCPETTPQWSRV